jgi:hypothetical protein
MPAKFDMPARQDLPGKEIAESTYKSYKTQLNKIASIGFTTAEELLEHQEEVVKYIKESGSNDQIKKTAISAVLKVLGNIKGSKLDLLKGYLDSFFPPAGTLMANGKKWMSRAEILAEPEDSASDEDLSSE